MHICVCKRTAKKSRRVCQDRKIQNFEVYTAYRRPWTDTTINTHREAYGGKQNLEYSLAEVDSSITRLFSLKQLFDLPLGWDILEVCYFASLIPWTASPEYPQPSWAIGSRLSVFGCLLLIRYYIPRVRHFRPHTVLIVLLGVHTWLWTPLFTK